MSTDHISELLPQYVRGALPEGERREVALHLALCLTCAQACDTALAEAAAVEQQAQADTPQAEIPPAPPAPVPVVEEQLVRMRRPAYKLLGAAAGVLVLLMLAIVFRPDRLVRRAWWAVHQAHPTNEAVDSGNSLAVDTSKLTTTRTPILPSMFNEPPVLIALSEPTPGNLPRGKTAPRRAPRVFMLDGNGIDLVADRFRLAIGRDPTLGLSMTQRPLAVLPVTLLNIDSATASSTFTRLLEGALARRHVHLLKPHYTHQALRGLQFARDDVPATYCEKDVWRRYGEPYLLHTVLCNNPDDTVSFNLQVLDSMTGLALLIEDVRVTRLPPHFDGIQDPRTITFLIAMLTAQKSDRASARLRDELVSALAAIGPPATPHLVATLPQVRDAKVRGQLIRVLGRTKDTRALPALIAMLGDRDVGKTVEDALLTLGSRAVPALINTLRRAPSEQVRARSAVLLGRIADSRASAALRNALTDANPQVRKAAVLALAELKSSNDPLLMVALLSDADADTRRRIVNALGGADDPRLVETLCGMLGRERATATRLGAARALGVLHDPGSIIPLITLLREESAGGRSGALLAAAEEALARCGSDAVPPLLDELRNAESPARLSVVKALGGIEDARAAQPLAELLKQHPADLRDALIDALGHLDDAVAVDALLPLLADPRAETRLRAVQALARRHPARALQPLAKLLQDDDAAVRGAALQAVAGFEDRQAAQPLVELLRKTDDATVISSVTEMLVRKGTPAFEAVIDMMRAGDSPALRSRGQQVLEAGGASAISALCVMTTDRDADLRLRAVALLGARPRDARTVLALIAAVRDEEPMVRALAAATLQRVTGKHFGEDHARWAAWWKDQGSR